MKTGIVSDIDGTLAGGEAGIPDCSLVERFCGETGRYSYLAYATGRTHAGAVNRIEELGLPKPAFWVCELGCDVRRSDGEHISVFPPDRASALLTDRKMILSVARRHGCTVMEVYEARLSLHFGELNDAEAFRLLSENWGFTHVLTSPNASDTHTVDLLPAGAGKGSGIRAAVAALGLSQRFLYFGDADNDLCALGAAQQGYLMPHASKRVMAASPASRVLKRSGLAGVLEVLGQSDR